MVLSAYATNLETAIADDIHRVFLGRDLDQRMAADYGGGYRKITLR